MPIPAQRDPGVTAKAIASWLQDRIDGAHEVVVANLSVPATSGFSNETIMADASWTDASGRPASEQLVVRVKPTGYQVFLESDFERQHQLLTVLDAETPVAVPPLLWAEEDPSVLGAPFFVMRKVPGQAAPDQPPYNQAGWLAEATPEHREQVWRNAIAALIEVHRVPTEKVSFLAKPDLGPTGFDQLFEYWRRSFVWAARGHPQPVAEAALEWLERNLPAARSTALSWGDARIGNILFDDARVSAVVDWEMLSLGGHLVDLGWWLFLDDFHSFEVPRLTGLGSRADTIAGWEAGTGERATDLDWYEMFAGFRFAIVMMRLMQMFEAFGLPRDDRADPERNNPVTHLLARKLGMKPPGSLTPSS